jgi:hypothetical protein
MNESFLRQGTCRAARAPEGAQCPDAPGASQEKREIKRQTHAHPHSVDYSPSAS